MFGFFKGVFMSSPKENSAYARQINIEIENIFQELTGNIALEKTIDALVDRLAKSSFHVVNIMDNFNVPVRGAVLILLLDVSGSIAKSGKYHTDKRILRDLIKIWDFAACELYEIKALPRQKIIDARRDIEAAINAMNKKHV